MTTYHSRSRHGLTAACLLTAALPARAQIAAAGKSGVDLYGFIETGMIADFNTMNPQWYDMMRPTKLPAFQDQWGLNGNFWPARGRRDSA